MLGSTAVTVLAAALLAAGAPFAGSSDSPPTLDGTAWVLAALPGETLPPGRAATLRFEGGRARGFDGCNQFVAPYTSEGATLAVAATGVATQMACPPERARAAQAFADALRGARGYRVEAGQLQLLAADGRPVATLAAQPKLLAGTAWEATAINNGKQAVASVASDSSVTLGFGADGTASGSAGCNRYTGRYVSDGSKLTFGPTVTTRKMCPRLEVMEQEQSFLNALGTVATATVEGDRLELRTATGALAVGLTRAPRP